MNIPFNKPYLTGKELVYIEDAVLSGKTSGNGSYTKKCHSFFEDRYNFKKVLLTTSCTDALEMAAILADIQSGDEVIVPAYTFVSTANAFVLRGAKIVFVDSCANHPNLDAEKLESLITTRTKAIVAVHYAGMACDMNKIMAVAEKYDLLVIEDAAQAIESRHKEKGQLGGIGHLGAFSFHETKNIISGEGGMLVINDQRFIKRAEIIWEKGTDRVAFSKGEVNKYQWVDIGSSFLPSDITAAFLYSQLENIDNIQQRRKQLWENYYQRFIDLQSFGLSLPHIPEYATNNAHIFYICCETVEIRNQLLEYLNTQGIYSVFHYLSLEQSVYYKNTGYLSEPMLQARRFEQTLLRLPLYVELTYDQQEYIISAVNKFFRG